jgi:hypothetical protein
MITLSTEIKVKSSPEELFLFLQTLEGVFQCFEYKKIKQRKIENNRVEFILRNAAVFKFQIGKVTETYVQIDSVKEVPFMTAIQFEIAPAEEGSFVNVHLETDTSPVMDFTFESKAKRWLTSIAENLERIFN